MKVKQLKIKAFRGIQDLTLEFDQNQPTVLIGINGAGKSSILDCLSILLAHLSVPIIKFIESNKASLPGFDIFPRFDEQDINNQEQGLQIDLELLLDSQLLPVTLMLERGFIDSDSREIKEGFYELILNKMRTRPEANIPFFIYYKTNRAVVDISLESPKVRPLFFPQLAAYDGAMTGGKVVFANFFTWFRTQEDLENEVRLNDNPAHRDRKLEAVRMAITSLMPDFSDLRVKRSPLRMTVIKQGQELIINQLSDGEKCLLAMVGDLARRLAIANPGLDNPLEGEGVVLIDEIELHLHPKWQRAIVPALTRTFPNCQFIVTTHSPQVLSEVQPNSIYILESTDRGIIAKRPTSSFGRDSNQILEDLMDVPERPENVKEQILEIFRLIDAGDLEGAKRLRQQIAGEIGADEPELVKASTSIRRREILNK